MGRRLRTASAAAALVVASGLGACSSSGSDAGTDEAPTTVPADDRTTTTAAASASTTDAGTATTEADGASSTTEAAPPAPGELDELPDCQQILQDYSEQFDPDDLGPVATLFRTWAPLAPDEVAEAMNNLADAYDEAGGKLSGIELTDVDLTADAEVFSDWTSDGCPAK